nr:hypothetical protein [Rhodoferax sp.]
MKKNEKASFRDISFAKLRRQLGKARTQRKTISSNHNIEDLVCGVPVVVGSYIDSDYAGLVDRLRSDLAELHPQIQAAVGTDTILPASAVFPFLARKFLELSLTSLLARIDPLRVIAARKNQRDSSFETGRQNASSISWTGDIFPKNPPPKGNVWQSQSLEKGVERSVLGWHFGEVAIAPGLQWLSDVDNSNSEWLRELSNQEKPFEWIKGRLTQLYSTLSKGVHAEYLLDDRTAFDQASVQQHMQDCYRFVLLLSAATHVSPLFYRSLTAEDALGALKKIEDQIVVKDK